MLRNNTIETELYLNGESLDLKQKEKGTKKTHSDQKYIDALLNNDMVLLEELYQKFFGKIKSLALQNNGTEADAADIFQDTLLSLYHKAKYQNFVLTCPLGGFLHLVWKNRWINELSKRKYCKTRFDDAGDHDSTGEEPAMQMEEYRLLQARKDLLLEKLAELGESFQQLLLLSWSGKPMQEVAITL